MKAAGSLPTFLLPVEMCPDGQQLLGGAGVVS